MINREPHYGDAIASLCPDAEWSVEDGDLANLTWISPTEAPVTNEEIIAEVERLKAVQVEEEAAKKTALESAKAKLAKLGLTAEEAAAIVGA